MLSRRKGFTLIELIVVMIIVGVLAAIAGPLMKGNIDKAKRTEAVSALGAIRAAERCYYVQNNTYATVTDFSANNSALRSYIGATDLAGKYYPVSAYQVNGGSTFTAYANNATYGNVTMNQTGTLTGD